MNRFRDLLPQFFYLPARVVYPRTRFEPFRLAPVPVPVSTARPGQPTFVVIVSAEPRKNLNAVVRAFRKMPHADLVVIGYAGGTSLMRNPPPNVRFAGYVEEHDKATLISDAHGLIMPSLAEGFGVPIIEALAANTPVLCSDIAVFREVAGELADYFDPFSTDRSARPSPGCCHVRTNGAASPGARGELVERFGPQTQARDLLAPAGYRRVPGRLAQ